MLWKETSKETWLEEGDQNSNFVHLSTIIKRNINRMDLILNRDQEVVTDFEGIGSIFVEYYKELFSTVDPIFPSNFEAL